MGWLRHTEPVPEPVALSTGETVTFKPYFSHQADVAFWEEVSRRVDPQTKEVTNWVYQRACEAVLPVLVESVLAPGSEPRPCTPEWLGNLRPEDYALLERTATDLRNDMLAK